MSKAKFTYDESGATFFYFVLSFLALILVPCTYYLWPSEPQDDYKKTECQCGACQNKRRHLGDYYRWKRSRRRLSRALIVIGWLAFGLLAYKCATIQHEYVNWDPFEILGVREDASQNDIKKAYRKLSLIYHPDKETGNEERFVKITKAYAALTDDEARKNWELYGNPDGPGATSFGIALPSWIVEKENSVVVLGIYALIFMVALPVSVGLWWYRSVKYGCDKVLITTSEVYYYFIHKTPTMALKRVIMILASSLEFAKTHNPEVVERESDNVEVPRLIRDLPMLGEKNTERPLCLSYSIKSRAILHAHLGRMRLPAALEADRCFIVRKCPYLIQEFVQCVAQLITLALSGRTQNMPSLATLENAMKLSALVVQALWEYQSPLLQLPHFTDEALRHLERKKLKLRSIEQLARMKECERREALKYFSEAQYEDIRLVMGSMPVVRVEAKFEVLDDEDASIITAHSIVTVVVKLSRRPMRDLLERAGGGGSGGGGEAAADHDHDDLDQREPDRDPDQDHRDSHKAQPRAAPKAAQAAAGAGPESADELAAAAEQAEDDWQRKFQEKVIKKQKVFESRPRKSHPVHCPLFPDDKQEFWWVYLVDRKRGALVTAPLLLTNLVGRDEVELKFTAPPKPGPYAYTVVVRSDSYVDCTVQTLARLEVKPARAYEEPVYDIPEDEQEQEPDDESAVEDSDLLTDSDSEGPAG